MGLVEGPILPLVQSIIALGSPVQRRGMNMGIVQSLGSSILGLFIAPFFSSFLRHTIGGNTDFLWSRLLVSFARYL